jgi:hypothetical protein
MWERPRWANGPCPTLSASCNEGSRGRGVVSGSENEMRAKISSELTAASGPTLPSTCMASISGSTTHPWDEWRVYYGIYW